MEIAALAAAIAALVVSVLSFAAVCLLLALHSGRGEREERPAARQGPEEADREREEAEKSRSMDEGFENIMSFSVTDARNGRGGVAG